MTERHRGDKYVYKGIFKTLTLAFQRTIKGFRDKYYLTYFIDTCNEGKDSVSGSSCVDSMFLNATTGFCQLCEDGWYYDSTSRMCQQCNGSGFDRGAYQMFGFECKDGEFFDLEQMEGVVDGGAYAIAINDLQFHNLPIGRSYDYYVNPNSEEIIELGTKAYPYKNIGLPFVEILNYHSHSGAIINVYIKEKTTNLGQWNSNYIINITHVNIESYSDIGGIIPAYANITIMSSGVTMLTSTTVFNIISSNERRLDENLNGDMTDNEKAEIQNTDAAFMITRSSFTLKRFNIVSKFSNSNDKVDVI